MFYRRIFPWLFLPDIVYREVIFIQRYVIFLKIVFVPAKGLVEDFTEAFKHMSVYCSCHRRRLYIANTMMPVIMIQAKILSVLVHFIVLGFYLVCYIFWQILFIILTSLSRLLDDIYSSFRREIDRIFFPI